MTAAAPVMTQPSAPTVGAACCGATAMAVASGGGFGVERTQRPLNGWTVVWVGERAFRATAAMKEQIEQLGFLVKVYRSHDKSCRALDKKPTVTASNAFVLTGAETKAVLQYLCSRGAAGVRIVVDVEGMQAVEVQQLVASIQHPQDSVVSMARSWDEVLAALSAVSIEASMQPAVPQLLDTTRQLETEIEAEAEATTSVRPATWAPVDRTLAERRHVEVVQAEEVCRAPSPSGAASAAGCGAVVPISGSILSGATSSARALDQPWTLVWISDQAFKPAAVQLKAQLESLGCQVKGYKTHKNAARALDKKRALARTVVLVTHSEAAPFLAYLNSRPEIGATRVVVEATSRSSPLRETFGSCQVVEGFDAAVNAVWTIAADPGFV